MVINKYVISPTQYVSSTIGIHLLHFIYRLKKKYFDIFAIKYFICNMNISAILQPLILSAPYLYCVHVTISSYLPTSRITRTSCITLKGVVLFYFKVNNRTRKELRIKVRRQIVLWIPVASKMTEDVVTCRLLLV